MTFKKRGLKRCVFKEKCRQEKVAVCALGSSLLFSGDRITFSSVV
jgi:hypothetical protein